ncbi:SdpI family protein [Chitinophaga pinensis]|uniref:SdpI family protein n=1 Tax=Chitinophaga pinensis (strain ATCC 43595 / DSM 2588 / LMG 13176 / NBRC 15968 / NCIMB 11800 / UQM 2034) TaxID=485918 RepID=A0A979GR33_CHIPD|nr:SdpI family protein [Chitinophaga pinensis]ACU58534.1 conserved hypothetical protein [Chitinophaga pinensis DSM 2588]
MFSISSLLISPFLTGIVFVLAALISKQFPPKKINPVYGYRTRKSMENEENWQLANQYSNSVMLKAGLGLMLLGLILSFFAFNQAIMGVLTAVSALAGGIVIFLFTEKQLK